MKAEVSLRRLSDYTIHSIMNKSKSHSYSLISHIVEINIISNKYKITKDSITIFTTHIYLFLLFKLFPTLNLHIVFLL
jgi:hypothetical protein